MDLKPTRELILKTLGELSTYTKPGEEIRRFVPEQWIGKAAAVLASTKRDLDQQIAESETKADGPAVKVRPSLMDAVSLRDFVVLGLAKNDGGIFSRPLKIGQIAEVFGVERVDVLDAIDRAQKVLGYETLSEEERGDPQHDGLDQFRNLKRSPAQGPVSR